MAKASIGGAAAAGILLPDAKDSQASPVVASTPNVYDVTEYGVTPDNPADTNSANLMQLINNVLPSNSLIGASQHYSHASVVLFPSADGEYSFDSVIVVPSSKSISFVTEAPNGAHLTQTNTDTHLLFSLEGGGVNDYRRHITFDNLVFYKGGVQINGPSRKRTLFRNCFFYQTPQYAICTGQESVIGGLVESCEFTECYGGVCIEDVHSDLWLIHNSHFYRNEGADLSLRSTGIRVDECDFEVKPRASTSPYILVRFGAVSITNCRFGSERDSLGKPAASTIIFGELGGYIDSVVEDVLLQGNRFFGQPAAEPESLALHAIEFNKRPNRIRIIGNEFREYRGFLIQDNTPAYNLQKHERSNHFIGNTSKYIPISDAFSNSEIEKAFGIQLEGSIDWNLESRLRHGKTALSPPISVTGADYGDFAVVSAPYDLQGVVASGYVYSPDTVKISVFNSTSSAVTLGAGIWKVRLFRSFSSE